MQYYVVNTKIENEFILEKTDEFHLKNVMRAKINTRIYCIYKSKHYLCEVIQIEPNLKIKIINFVNTNNENDFQINLVVGMIKKPKWEILLQKATELGVNRIIPAYFQNTMIKLDKSDIAKKIIRWNSICKEATEQSRRNTIPQITDILYDINDLKKYQSSFNIVCYEKSVNFIKNVIDNKLNTPIKSVTIVIGSEGGFSLNEIEIMKNLGFSDTMLTKQVLRTETAVIYTLSIINFLFRRYENDKF